MPSLQDINIRDPFVLPLPESGRYWLYGTAGATTWSGACSTFSAWSSRDLVTWEGPVEVFRAPDGFAGSENYWAPEVHRWQGRFWLLASFKNPQRRRWTQALVADAPDGPFRPVGEGLTPRDWDCLDGTLFIDGAGDPWLVFCHEWVQVADGRMMAARLAPGLDRILGEPIELFRASAAPWVVPIKSNEVAAGRVTDGPFLRRSGGRLLMLWSSIGRLGYAMGVATSDSGRIEGPWRQDAEPIHPSDGGHGMIFADFAGKLWMTLHMPNNTPMERPRFIPITDAGGRLVVQPTPIIGGGAR